MDAEELRKDLEFYKKRFENAQKEKEILKQETQILRKELNGMKEFVKKIVIPKKGVDIKSADHKLDQNDMLTILDFQRKKIDQLEKESEEIKKKYDKVLFEEHKDGQSVRPASAVLAEHDLSAEAALDKANERVALLETKLKGVTSNYAKETSDLRNKLVETQANEVLNISRSPGSLTDTFIKSMSMSVSSATFRKKDSLLEPIKSENMFNTPQKHNTKPESQPNSKSKTDEEQASLFSYKKRTLSRQTPKE